VRFNRQNRWVSHPLLILVGMMLIAVIGAVIAALAVGAGVALVVARALASQHEFSQRSESLTEQVRQMSGHLGEFRQLVTRLQSDQARQTGELAARLDEAARVQAHLSDVTGGLREALASPKARGQWGERMAEDVLRLAGFAEGVNYRKQRATAAGTVPDFTFLLPQGLLLHMDVKFPVDNYLRYLECEGRADQARLRDAFLKDVRARVRELTRRDYADAETTVGFLLLFIPNESVFAFIGEHAPELFDEALGSGVLLCSPCTLFAQLALVRQSLDSVAVEQASKELLVYMGGFTEQWEKFTAHLDVVGKRLESTLKAYEELNGPRRRQLERKLDRVEDLRQREGLAQHADDVPALRAVGAD